MMTIITIITTIIHTSVPSTICQLVIDKIVFNTVRHYFHSVVSEKLTGRIYNSKSFREFQVILKYICLLLQRSTLASGIRYTCFLLISSSTIINLFWIVRSLFQILFQYYDSIKPEPCKTYNSLPINHRNQLDCILERQEHQPTPVGSTVDQFRLTITQ